jgi:hypothetical protein
MYSIAFIFLLVLFIGLGICHYLSRSYRHDYYITIGRYDLLPGCFSSYTPLRDYFLMPNPKNNENIAASNQYRKYYYAFLVGIAIWFFIILLLDKTERYH